jgi:hypothetical protein
MCVMYNRHNRRDPLPLRDTQFLTAHWMQIERYTSRNSSPDISGRKGSTLHQASASFTPARRGGAWCDSDAVYLYPSGPVCLGGESSTMAPWMGVSDMQDLRSLKRMFATGSREPWGERARARHRRW